MIQMTRSGALARSQTEEVATRSGKWIQLLLVSFGLLCVVQASLNVCLRLFSETRHRHVTEENNELRQKLHNLSTFLDSVDQWIYFKGSFYCGFTAKLPWQDSREYCEQRGAHLLISSSPEEQAFVTSTFKERSWLGLSDLEREGVWTWVDGSQLTRSFWLPGEPNSRTKAEDCAEINYKQLGAWNDLKCDTPQQFICEKTMALV